MLLAVIVACEVGFWLFVLLGSLVRYALRKPRLGKLLLLCAPFVDVALLVATVFDLRSGHAATPYDALAGVYIGVSVAWGKSMMRGADQRVAHRIDNAPPQPPKPRYGRAHAAKERRAWGRHVIAWAAGSALLLTVVLVVGDAHRTQALLRAVELWTLVLVIDGVISLSYTIAPRREHPQRR